MQVDMLYINLDINRHNVAAFVDSGAQMTIIGQATAGRLGLLHLVDRRFAGVAKGVGTGKILGRIHQVFVQSDRFTHLPSFAMGSFSEQQPLLVTNACQSPHCVQAHAAMPAGRRCMAMTMTGGGGQHLAPPRRSPCRCLQKSLVAGDDEGGRGVSGDAADGHGQRRHALPLRPGHAAAASVPGEGVRCCPDCVQ